MSGPGLKIYKKKYPEEDPLEPGAEGYEFFELREKIKAAPEGDDEIFKEFIQNVERQLRENNGSGKFEIVIYIVDCMIAMVEKHFKAPIPCLAGESGQLKIRELRNMMHPGELNVE